MKLSLTQENLSRALGSVGRIVSTRSTLPVLSNVLLSAEGNQLRLSATNLEIGIHYIIRGKVDEEGTLTVPARLFSDFVGSLPDGNIELESQDYNLQVRTKHYQSHLNGISSEEYPLIPRVSGTPIITLPAAEIKQALQQVVVAASLDEARPVLAGVYLFREDDELVVVATDSYRLAERRLPFGEGKEDVKVIIPARTIQELIRLIGDEEGELEVYLADNQVMFKLADIELVSRLIEGSFPPYQQIVPKETETGFEIDTAEFSRITKVASLFARENNGSVRLEIKAEGEVKLISSDSEVGGNTSSAECEALGEDGEVALNARYLSEALSVIGSDTVQFGLSGRLNPCVLQPAGDESSYLHIIMPLRT